jgi:hypothetical protein
MQKKKNIPPWLNSFNSLEASGKIHQESARALTSLANSQFNRSETVLFQGKSIKKKIAIEMFY